MLNSISWGQYLSAIAVVLILYYLYVGFKYFRWEILSLIGITKADDDKIIIAAPTNMQHLEKHEDYLPKSATNNTKSPLLHQFEDEVTAYLNQTEIDISKHEIIDGLQQLIEKYPAAQNAEYRNELTYFIAAAVNTKYPQLLQASDIKLLWN